jgi:hypothetical protein
MYQIVEFLLFAFAQSIVILGIANASEKGYILERPSEMIRRVLGPVWSKPIIGCVRCMSSFWGSATYWPVVIWKYDFHGWQFGIWVADVFALVYLNWFLYKRQ